MAGCEAARETPDLDGHDDVDDEDGGERDEHDAQDEVAEPGLHHEATRDSSAVGGSEGAAVVGEEDDEEAAGRYSPEESEEEADGRSAQGECLVEDGCGDGGEMIGREGEDVKDGSGQGAEAERFEDVHGAAVVSGSVAVDDGKVRVADESGREEQRRPGVDEGEGESDFEGETSSTRGGGFESDEDDADVRCDGDETDEDEEGDSDGVDRGRHPRVLRQDLGHPSCA